MLIVVYMLIDYIRPIYFTIFYYIFCLSFKLVNDLNVKVYLSSRHSRMFESKSAHNQNSCSITKLQKRRLTQNLFESLAKGSVVGTGGRLKLLSYRVCFLIWWRRSNLESLYPQPLRLARDRTTSYSPVWDTTSYTRRHAPGMKPGEDAQKRERTLQSSTRRPKPGSCNCSSAASPRSLAAITTIMRSWGCMTFSSRDSLWPSSVRMYRVF